MNVKDGILISERMAWRELKNQRQIYIRNDINKTCKMQCCLQAVLYKNRSMEKREKARCKETAVGNTYFDFN